MILRINRRRFFASTGAAASLALLADAVLPPKSASAASLYVRRNVGGMNAFDPVIASYRKAIKAMRGLPASDPRSWSYQAAIHGTFTTPPQTAWNTCQHGNYFFWSWHRMYLYWFERICRRMACDDCFALPYWDYNSASERQLPPTFRDPSSELFVSQRDPNLNSGAGSLPAWAVSYTVGLAQTNFTSASSSFEQLPHNIVHVLVGGPGACANGWMGCVPTAAQDPIFFLHHCNMDRLWNLWLAQGGGRIDPIWDVTWKSTTWTFFDEEGAQVEMNGCEILRAAQQLHYVYEGEPPQVNDYCLPIIKFPPIIFEKELILKLPVQPITLGPEPVLHLPRRPSSISRPRQGSDWRTARGISDPVHLQNVLHAPPLGERPGAKFVLRTRVTSPCPRISPPRRSLSSPEPCVNCTGIPMPASGSSGWPVKDAWA